MKNRRLFKKIVATMAMLALATGIAAPAGVFAAETAVDKLVEFSISKNITALQTITDEASNTTINVKTVYPYVKVAGDTALAKAIRKALKTVAYTNVCKQINNDLAAGDVYPSDAIIDFEITYDAEASSRCGNIGSFVFTKSVYVEGGAFPVNETLVANINLTNGKKPTLASLFTSSSKIRSFLAKTAKAYADGIYKDAEPLFALDDELKDEYAFFGNLKLADVKAAVDIYSTKFNWDGVTLYFDETDNLWPHAFGTQEMFIPYDDIVPYIKSTKTQLFRPYSVEVIKLEYNAGTGYTWLGGADSDEDCCLELIYESSYAKNPSPMLMGGRMVDVIVYKATKEGRADISFKLARPWDPDGTPADTYERKLVVTSDLFITDVNE